MRMDDGKNCFLAHAKSDCQQPPGSGWYPQSLGSRGALTGRRQIHPGIFRKRAGKAGIGIHKAGTMECMRARAGITKRDFEPSRLCQTAGHQTQQIKSMI